jgi:hypothetical protein
MRSRFGAAISIAAVLAAGMTPGHAADGERYEGGGTVAVAKINGVTVIDNGAAICRPGGASTGGACVGFADVEPGSDGRGQSVYLGVLDDAQGADVAFQVCIDNNGDGVCGGPDGAGFQRCGDDQFFSHDDEGRFFNPLGPLPNSFRQDCPGSSSHAGFVVFLCTGVHSSDGTDAHAHTVTDGTAKTVVSDDATPSYGNFCGGGGGAGIPVNGAVLQAKPYTVE